MTNAIRHRTIAHFLGIFLDYLLVCDRSIELSAHFFGNLRFEFYPERPSILANDSI